MQAAQQPIGVFDSGVGGISTLKVLAAALPNEDFVFYGDSLNAPYGNKSTAQVTELSTYNIHELLGQSVKAVVIACNTATSAAKPALVEKFPELPILGIEPALKQAVDAGNQHILVMGTALTLSLPKYQAQVTRFADQAQIDSLPCPGLADLIEQGDAAVPEIQKLVARFIATKANQNYDAVVLGCTHYPFIEKIITQAIGHPVNVYTGYDGLANNLKQQLAVKKLLNQEKHQQSVRFMSSKDTTQELALYQHLYDFGIQATN